MNMEFITVYAKFLCLTVFLYLNAFGGWSVASRELEATCFHSYNMEITFKMKVTRCGLIGEVNQLVIFSFNDMQ